MKPWAQGRLQRIPEGNNHNRPTKATGNLRRRVLITDGEARAALAACRSLCSTGYEVDVVASDGPAPVHWSRCCSQRLWAPDPRADRGAFANSLNELLARGRYDLLLPGSDAALLAISEDRDRLSRLVTIGLPRRETVLRCLSKIAIFEVSQATELAAPRTKVCRTAEEARNAGNEIGFPLLVKPRMSAQPWGTGLRQRSSSRVSSESELAATIEDFGMPLLLQRWLRGPVHSIGGVVTDQGLAAAAHSRYVRTWPPDAGNVSCSVSLPLPAELREATAALLDRLGWRGIFELELMEKPGGSLGVIDLNPRVYGSLELAVRAGASLPAIWCDSLLESPVRSEVRDARAGVWYRWEDADVRHGLSRLRSGALRDVAPMLRPRRGSAHALFRLSDPGPLFARMISAVRGRRRARRRDPQPQPGERRTPPRRFVPGAKRQAPTTDSESGEEHETPTAGSAA
jgi:predicted ATP-grasp superfamily ATP-dependent carboligase